MPTFDQRRVCHRAPTTFHNLCLCVLHSCIVLSVECGGSASEDERLEYAL
ncbi:hypothetical protein [Helicobacter bizzozeronii]|uniref:Uncharacterized protein n=1 Tax=Helicobacter bizzozeronii (strain CIII-1) TaxID=1002804 RepID=F8KR62_HELBC|nr:hypothetical protein [Helicobacter bizzozeronii]CCB79236.1 hypothetical protein HBZC1_02500 [Helicobacter bizzozeronii CIII-1]CCF80517.1 hypothetical protein HBZS_109650 [Helicobacter bizzozeronii CCUG 35545]